MVSTSYHFQLDPRFSLLPRCQTLSRSEGFPCLILLPLLFNCHTRHPQQISCPSNSISTPASGRTQTLTTTYVPLATVSQFPGIPGKTGQEEARWLRKSPRGVGQFGKPQSSAWRGIRLLICLPDFTTSGFPWRRPCILSY